MDELFNKWWYQHGGSEEWAKTVDTSIIKAIKLAFYAGVRHEKLESNKSPSTLEEEKEGEPIDSPIEEDK